jgi:hypothetical protein
MTTLTKIVDHILKEMDQGNYTGVLFLDFKKAFDMVNHTMYLFHIFIQLNVNVRYGIRREVYNGIIYIQI